MFGKFHDQSGVAIVSELLSRRIQDCHSSSYFRLCTGERIMRGVLREREGMWACQIGIMV